ncbi:MAG: mechanosensitive ion channel [Flavobacteriales bacterium]|nr:mechanosensitive ion channel [Flavobacteriales bacterium]HOP43539.1 mechanosensitive ion channel [Flavobacteriales bacterium]HPF67592.1 mechanosensitive ion channel [Flavobacteriales bacterium]
MREQLKGLSDFFELRILKLGKIDLSIGSLVEMAIYLTITIVLLKVLQRVIMHAGPKKTIDAGRRKAIYNLVKYVVWVLAIMAMLDSVGVKITFLLAGATALLVGLGFGIQQIFNDIVSGVVIQIEGTISVGDVIEVEGLVGRVLEIHLRTSLIRTRDDIMIIVPNSRFVNDKVINWSTMERNTRFHVTVGVAYGSDVQLVTRVLLKCMREQTGISDHPAPFVRFNDFGDSALLFQAHFWSQQSFEIEHIKSELRYLIDKGFREHGIQIPFPQRDLHVRSWSSTASPPLSDR